MTEPEDQVRTYAAAVARAQRPIGLEEVMSARRRRGRRRIAVAAVTVAVAVIAGVVVVRRDHKNPTALVVAPSPSSSSPTTTTPAAAECPAASLVVSSTSGETLRAGWLPPGYTLTQGSETQLGAIGGPTYSAPGGGDASRVELVRYHSALPLARLFEGTPQPTEVQGHPGIVSLYTAMPEFTAILWRPTPGVALVVDGYKLQERDLREVADNVRYEEGSRFSYPAHPAVTVTRGQALAALHGSDHDKHAVLSSLGEISAVASSARGADIRSTLAPGISVTEPVWVAWTRVPAQQTFNAVVVIDAASGKTIATIPHIGSPPLESLTDRSTSACAPPFGVLTRSEVTLLERPQSGVTTIMKLATLGTIDKSEPGGPACGLPSSCDATVPVWLIIQIAADHRFVDDGPGPPGRPRTTRAGSFSITMMDARTGPQNTNFGGELGPGRPSAKQLAVPDLEP